MLRNRFLPIFSLANESRANPTLPEIEKPDKRDVESKELGSWSGAELRGKHRSKSDGGNDRTETIEEGQRQKERRRKHKTETQSNCQTHQPNRTCQWNTRQKAAALAQSHG
jgi:hypothetical protein